MLWLSSHHITPLAIMMMPVYDFMLIVLHFTAKHHVHNANDGDEKIRRGVGEDDY